jgi:hypothetical protein
MGDGVVGTRARRRLSTYPDRRRARHLQILVRSPNHRRRRSLASGMLMTTRCSRQRDPAMTNRCAWWAGRAEHLAIHGEARATHAEPSCLRTSRWSEDPARLSSSFRAPPRSGAAPRELEFEHAREGSQVSRWFAQPCASPASALYERHVEAAFASCPSASHPAGHHHRPERVHHSWGPKPPLQPWTCRTNSEW